MLRSLITGTAMMPCSAKKSRSSRLSKTGLTFDGGESRYTYQVSYQLHLTQPQDAYAKLQAEIEKRVQESSMCRQRPLPACLTFPTRVSQHRCFTIRQGEEGRGRCLQACFTNVTRSSGPTEATAGLEAQDQSQVCGHHRHCDAGII